MNLKNLTVVGKALVNVMENDTVKRFVLGTYSDGTTRSFLDVLDGEFVSPKDKEKAIKKYNKQRKKDKKILKAAKSPK